MHNLILILFILLLSLTACEPRGFVRTTTERYNADPSSGTTLAELCEHMRGRTLYYMGSTAEHDHLRYYSSSGMKYTMEFKVTRPNELQVERKVLTEFKEEHIWCCPVRLKDQCAKSR